MSKRSDIAGYDLFYGLEDKELQARNRATVLKNMFEDGCNHKREISLADAALMTEYIKAIPLDERALVLTKLEELKDVS